MRWKHKRPRPVALGEKRICQGFLWLPLRLEGETRWLERARWSEKCVMTGGEMQPKRVGWTGDQWLEL